jgi:hypothetical protein
MGSRVLANAVQTLPPNNLIRTPHLPKRDIGKLATTRRNISPNAHPASFSPCR